MEFTVQPFTVHKRFPLTISRGTTSQTTNLWLRLYYQGIEGWGEASPFSLLRGGGRTAAELAAEFEEIIPNLSQYTPFDRQLIAEVWREAQVSPSVAAALDTALHDWLGKWVKLPLWQLWGLSRSRSRPISVTVGINSPEGARERVRDWMQLVSPQILKVKLGNPAGIEADKAMLLAIREEAPAVELTVDANGGWSLGAALQMSHWLAGQGVTYVEQPLAVGDEGNLPQLYQQSPLPIFVDESCQRSQDIPRLAGCVHGLNIKLMKAGGLTEARRMVEVGRACGLQIMYGCYSDSSLANTALSHLAPLADYLDLDSHLNLTDDPFEGARLENGRLLPNYSPGLGVTRLQWSGKIL
jgi:L-alanine-DL-glutamate epimerase-like enolase superfamily enzyme